MEDDNQSTEECSYAKMQQEEEELKKACLQRDEHEDLLARNEELLQTITEQSRQLQELRQQLETEREKCRELKKQKDELVAYYVPQFEFLLKENQELTHELNKLNRSPNLDSPSHTYSSSSSSDGDQEEENQLEKFLSDGEKFDVECKPENLSRKLEAVRGFVMRDRAKKQVKMKSIVEDAKIKENRLLHVIKEREEQLTSTVEQFEEVKAVFTDVSTRLSLQVDSLSADLKKEKSENRRLRHSNQTTKRIETCSDSADVDNTDESTLSASNSSSNGIADDGADAASISTVLSSNSVADPLNSKPINYSIVGSMIEGVVESGKSPSAINQKRKDNLSDGEEVSKKLKSSTDRLYLASRNEISNELEMETKRQIMELERVVSKQTNNLKVVLAYNVKLQEALEKINKTAKKIPNERDVLPNTGSHQAVPWIPTENEVSHSPPVPPITREDARIFSRVEEYQLATFSAMHFMNASRNSSFLVNKPMGIDNPGRTFCYMNSVVQALSCIPLFAVNLVCGVDSEEGSLLHAMYQTYKHIWVRRPDAWNNNRPSKLNTKEIRSYYAEYHSLKFDPTRQHDAQEFLEDLISNLESEMSEQCGGVDEENLVTRLFRGYIVAPDGTKEYFRNLRLSIEDERVDSVENALLYHLKGWSPRPEPLAATVAENSSASTSYVDQEDDLTSHEKTDERSQVGTKKNELPLPTSSGGETEDFQMSNIMAMDHDAKPKSQGSVQIIATSEGMVDGDLHQVAHSVLDEFFFGNPITRKSIKIYTPDILCVSLNRHKFDYSFNYKVLPAKDLTIPADLRAPEGMKLPAHYKLMSIVQYIPVGSSAGHYYTFIMSGKGVACMLNDDSLTCVDIDEQYLAALDARSSIFIYAREPENLRWEPDSN